MLAQNSALWKAVYHMLIQSTGSGARPSGFNFGSCLALAMYLTCVSVKVSLIHSLGEEIKWTK